jgi:hypothetical protein
MSMGGTDKVEIFGHFVNILTVGNLEVDIGTQQPKFVKEDQGITRPQPQPR